MKVRLLLVAALAAALLGCSSGGEIPVVQGEKSPADGSTGPRKMGQNRTPPPAGGAGRSADFN